LASPRCSKKELAGGREGEGEGEQSSSRPRRVEGGGWKEVEGGGRRREEGGGIGRKVPVRT
jgi:hypothetical protein